MQEPEKSSSILEKIININERLNSISVTEQDKIPKKIIEKYNKFKEWLLKNGVIYNNIKFPVKYKVAYGCEASRTIPPNTPIFFIPYSMIIDSSKLNFYNIPESLNKNNSMKLIMFLLEEYSKGDNSFYKPYLDIILLNKFDGYCPFWTKNDFKELDDTEVESKINDYKNEITEIYEQIIAYKNINKNIDFELYKKFYVFVISRQFNIDENKMFLIPLADLLNHSENSDIKYEIFDTQNFVTKYAKNINENYKEDENILIQTDCSEYYKEQKDLVEKIKEKENEFNKRKRKQYVPEIEVNYDGDEPIEISTNDYFLITTNSNQVFKKGTQIFNNYGLCSNQYLLINYGFCPLYNKHDKTEINLVLKNIDTYTSIYLEDNYLEDIINKNTFKKDNIVKISLDIKSYKIGLKVSKLIRFISFLGKGDIREYKFKKNVEIEFYNKFIDILQQYIDLHSIQVFKAINILNDLLDKSDKEFNDSQFNIISYKLTQKLNLLFLKEALNYIKVILEKDKENKINSYKDLIKFIEEDKNCKSLYLSKDILKKIVVDYLQKVIKKK